MKQSISQLKEQLGWQGMAGIVLLALAGAFLSLTLKPLEQETTFMHSRVDAAVRSKSAIEARSFGLGDRQEELASFFDSLPAEEDVTDILAAIYSVADATGVELNQAEYHLEEKDRPRMEYGMNFPVKGEYRRIRIFLSRVLVDHPAIALDQINFQRDKIEDSTLKAEIRLMLFLKPSKTPVVAPK